MFRFGFHQYLFLSGAAALGCGYVTYQETNQLYLACALMNTNPYYSIVLNNLYFALFLDFSWLLKWVCIGSLSTHEEKPIQLGSTNTHMGLSQEVKARIALEVAELGIALFQFRSEMSQVFSLVGFLLLAKTFHWILAMRVKQLSPSTHVGRVEHGRLAGTLCLLGFYNLIMTIGAIMDYQISGVTINALFGFQHTLLLLQLQSTWWRYLLYLADHLVDNSWGPRHLVLFIIDCILKLGQLLVHFIFILLVAPDYGLPIYTLMRVYALFKSLAARIWDLYTYYTINELLDKMYPDATPTDLTNNNICSVCKEIMTAGPTTKRLRCNHVFHLHCLQQWTERQPICSTCRTPLDPRMHTPTLVQSQPVSRSAAPISQQDQPTNQSPSNLPNMADSITEQDNQSETSLPPPPFPIGLPPPHTDPIRIPNVDPDTEEGQREILLVKLRALNDMHARLDLISDMITIMK